MRIAILLIAIFFLICSPLNHKESSPIIGTWIFVTKVHTNILETSTTYSIDLHALRFIDENTFIYEHNYHRYNCSDSTICYRCESGEAWGPVNAHYSILGDTVVFDEELDGTGNHIKCLYKLSNDTLRIKVLFDNSLNSLFQNDLKNDSVFVRLGKDCYI